MTVKGRVLVFLLFQVVKLRLSTIQLQSKGDSGNIDRGGFQKIFFCFVFIE